MEKPSIGLKLIFVIFVILHSISVYFHHQEVTGIDVLSWMMVYAYFYFMLKGHSWAKNLISVVFLLLAVRSGKKYETEDVNKALYIIELAFLFSSFVFLNYKKVTSLFSMKPESRRFIFYGIKKCCPECKVSLSLRDLTLFMRSKEILCSNCKIPLRVIRNDKPNIFHSLGGLIIVLSSFTFTFLLVQNFYDLGTFLLAILFFGFLLFLRLITTGITTFKIPGKEFLNHWVTGGEPGHAVSEVGKTIYLKLGYDDSEIKCIEALEKTGCKITWKNEKLGIIKGVLELTGNNLQNPWILFNLKEMNGETEVKVFSRHPMPQGNDSPKVYDIILNEITKSLRGEECLNLAFRPFNDKTFTTFLMLFGIALFMAFSFYNSQQLNSKDDDVELLNYSNFLFLIFAFHFLINKVFVLNLMKISSFRKNPMFALEPGLGFKSVFLLAPVTIVLFIFVYHLNIAYDSSSEFILTGKVTDLKKNEKDYCFDVSLDDSVVLHRQYCFSKGYLGLKKGDDVEIRARKGLLGLQYSKSWKPVKYISLPRLMASTKGVESIGPNDLRMIEPDTDAFEATLESWKSECINKNMNYCRLFAYTEYTKKKPESGSIYLRKACNQGDSQACYDLLSYNEYSGDEKRDYEEKLKEECFNGKNESSCYQHANLLLRINDPNEVQKAKPLLVKACESKIMYSCTQLKWLELVEKYPQENSSI